MLILHLNNITNIGELDTCYIWYLRECLCANAYICCV